MSAVNLETAYLIGYVMENGVIVGDSSLKHPRQAFVDRVKSFTGLDFTGCVERGYTSVRPEYRSLGIGTRLLEGLTARAKDVMVYAIIDEKNIAAQKMAIHNNTRKIAAYFSEKVQKTMGVWMPDKMADAFLHRHKGDLNPVKIGIITVKDSTFHPNGRLIEEAGRLGHEVGVLIDPYRVSCHVGGNGAGIFIGTDAVTGDGPGPGMVLPDLILPRQGSPMGEYGFVLLRQLAMLRVPLVNSLEGVTISKHQYITLQRLFRAGLPVPHAFFVTRQDTFFSAVEALGGFPVVVKQVGRFRGRGCGKTGWAGCGGYLAGPVFKSGQGCGG